MIEAGPLHGRLARLRKAATGARSIGLDAEAAAAEEVAERIARRAGFGGSVYVMALAGGTGVGKSSVLNALAGSTVSEASAVRPTTDEPRAWLAETARAEVAPLLEWLNVRSAATHRDQGLAGVALLDLPDVDSVEAGHRALVDELLPRIDAVAWVVDPEKYDDERAHAYWRALASHADRLRFILNKADRLTDAQQRTIVDDLAARLAADGIARPVIHVMSARDGSGVATLREELARAADAKAIVAAKLEQDRAAAAERLARAVGVDPESGYVALLAPGRQAVLVREAVAGAIALIDPPGVARQIRSAVLHQARVGGGSMLARVVALIGSLTGQRRRRADPGGYLAAWRTRGALGRVLNPVREALVEAAAAVPAASRSAVLTAMGTSAVESELERALDRATRAEASSLRFPVSAVWPVIGALQIGAGGVVVFAIAWIVVLFVAGGSVPVETVDVPVLGPIPLPLALLVAGFLVSAILGWLLGLHASVLGRRVARDVQLRVESVVRQAVTREGFAGLERVEAARRTIAEALPPH